MADADRQSSRRERTMLVALLLSAPGPIVTGIPAFTSLSATQIADFLRRTAELVALLVGWWVYRQLRRRMGLDDPGRARLEARANGTVAGAMLCSGVAMLAVGVARLFVYEASGSVLIGLIIAVLGLLTNSWFWLRYRRMNQERFEPVVAGQQSLYRAKAAVDLCVVTALTAVTVAPGHPATRYIDAGGAMIVAGYLFINGWGLIRKGTAARGTAVEGSPAPLNPSRDASR